MGPILKWVIRLALGLVGLVAFLLVGGFILLNTSWLQEKLKTKTVALLTEKLDTRVVLDSVSIDLLTLDAKIYGLTVEDRQQRKMLQMDFLKADVDLWPLLEDEIRITEAKVEGLRAELHKLPKDSLSPDTVANFQFVLDAFKADKKKPVRTDSVAKKKKKLAFVMNKLTAERLQVQYNSDSVSLGYVQYTQTRHGAPKGRVEDVKARWEHTNKKGQLVTHNVGVQQLSYSEQDGERLVDLHRLNFRTDNHLPRKNAGKPKRGFFDVGHFNVWADMKLVIDRIADGTVHGRVSELTAQDSVTGIDIRKLLCEVTANKEGMQLENVEIQQGETQLHFERGNLYFPNKKTGAKLRYSTSTIGGTAILKDISRPFAPVLRNFTLPLNLSVRMEGDDEGMRFRDVAVTRPGGLLSVKAQGTISGLKDKHALRVHFDVSQAVIKGGEKERIINQFTVKKFMMKQLHQLGTLHYKGSFNVLWKKEEFQGLVQTKAGNINFYFALDENNKYLNGRAQASGVKLGEVMDMPDIGPVTANADFRFDISKPRTAIMRRKLGGKLPIGQVTAHVTEASYKFVKVRNVDVQMVSNGAIAEGSLQAPGKFADLSCTFSFTNTNEMKKTKIKPAVKLNIFKKKTSEEQEQKKLQKQAEKEAKKQRKAEEKAAKAEAKAARKAEKAAAKAARKAAKAEEKAARKAAKATAQ